MLNSVGQVQVTLQLVQLTSSNQKFGIYTGDSLGCPFFALIFAAMEQCLNIFFVFVHIE